MEFLGEKLTEVQTHVSGWMGSMRRSLQEAVELVSGTLEREGVINEEEDEERVGRFERAISPLRSFASRGRQSLRNLSQTSRQRFSLRKRTTTPNSNNGHLKDSEPEEDAVVDEGTENPHGETDEQSENQDDVDGLSPESRIGQALQRLTRAKRRNTSTDSDTPDDVPDEEESKALPVLESAAPLLDSSVLRSKVDLSKKRSIKRSRPSRAVRQRGALPALTEGTNPDWRFCDSTDAKEQCFNEGDSESEEEPSRDAVFSPAPCKPKKVPMFPGINASALMAQLKRRSGMVEADSPTEAQTPPSVPARSPRTPTMALGPRVLPPVDAKDSASGSSPSWLLELKSKKRMNQPESEA